MSTDRATGKLVVGARKPTWCDLPRVLRREALHMAHRALVREEVERPLSQRAHCNLILRQRAVWDVLWGHE